MRWLGSLSTFWIVVALLLASNANANDQMLCVERVDMLNRLASEYGEELVEVKMMEEHGLLEVLRSPATGTWTLLLTRPGGITCVLATGEGLGTNKDSLEKTEYML